VPLRAGSDGDLESEGDGTLTTVLGPWFFVLGPSYGPWSVLEQFRLFHSVPAMGAHGPINDGVAGTSLRVRRRRPPSPRLRRGLAVARSKGASGGGENQALRRWPDGPPAPGVIRATANNRFDTQLHRTVITIDAAPALAAPPDLIYRLALIAAAHKSLAARVARRADAIDRRGGSPSAIARRRCGCGDATCERRDQRRR
jgi:hypothetical protein